MVMANGGAERDDLVLFEKDGGIAWLTLNRPEALNAVNLAMRDQLWTLLLAVRDDPEIGCLVIRGNGEKAFCAGADVKEFGTAPSYLAARDARLQRDLWGLMLSLEKPLIAAVHGWALGAGCEMSLLCDLRLAAEDARFGLPEVNLGYIPSAGGTQTLPRHMPRGVALGMIMTGEPIDARQALALGMVHDVVPRPRLYDEARALAERLLSRPAFAVRLAREALRAAMDLPLAQGLSVSHRLGQRTLHAVGPDRAAALAGWSPAHG
ncbi:MAG TPA: enoyl-CoA hydratase/isomerase family protein [Dehalococcoidia bacterium]|nr:enoyl-CoA hydratase/isomerase family protein [Dehalococcoidia bacterium]